ncbi:MAG TPA: hypothetical protein DCZ94_21665 [Lentisphaeria bacterium]|nr:MAG: hypothetical protein A2X48_14595 [Lentisphaerae bacterium GWF2_49_21]HBC89554.1 hypothetical protein [Lentisphaeria bacterium]
MDNLRNVELENKVLGTIMAHPEKAVIAIYLMGSFWTAAWTEPGLKAIAGAVYDLAKNKLLPDRYTVEQKLQFSDQAQFSPEIEKVMAFAETSEILDNRVKLLVQLTSMRLSHLDFNQANELIKAGKFDDFSKHKDKIRQNLAGRSVAAFGLAISAEEACSDCVKALETRMSHPGMTGIPTGIHSIDTATLGLQFGMMNILAARPSHGKTALAAQIAVHAAAFGFPVLYFSHEMLYRQIFMRMICNRAELDTRLAQNGKFNSGSFDRYKESASAISKLPITIIDDPSISPQNCCDFLRYHASKHDKQGLVMVDYFQLESIPGFRGQRPEEIAEISKLWRSTLKEIGWSSLMVAQLNRNSSNKPPQLADLKGSGSLEQDAHTVMLLYRPGHELPDKPANRAELSMPKNRDGNLTRDILHFRGYCQKFEAWSDYNHVNRTYAEMQSAEEQERSNQETKS